MVPGQLRIIGGKGRGVRLEGPGRNQTRPMTDRVKESLFNIIAQDVPGAIVADCFAGSGALGLEAISRGATRACFVEKSRQAAGVIRQNIATAHFEDQSQIVVVDLYRRGWETLPDLSEPYNLIFLDPPYAHARGLDGESPLSRLLEGFSDWQGGARDVILILRHERDVRPPKRYGRLEKTDRREYGTTTLSFYR